MLELSECRKWHLAACVCEEAHSIVHICGKLYEDHAGLTQTHTHTSQIQRASQKDIHSLETNSGKKMTALVKYVTSKLSTFQCAAKTYSVTPKTCPTCHL